MLCKMPAPQSICGDYLDLMTITTMATKIMTMPMSSTFNGNPKKLLAHFVDDANPGIDLGGVHETDAARMRNDPAQDVVR